MGYFVGVLGHAAASPGLDRASPGRIESAPFDYNPLSKQVQDDPYPFYRRLTADYPLYHNPGMGFWALSRYDDVRAAFRDWRTYSSAEGVNLEPGFTEMIGPEILNMDPPRHDQLRRLIGHHFTLSRVRSYEPMVREFAVRLLTALIAEGGGDFAADFAGRLPVLTICRLMGIPLEDEATVRSLAHDMLLALSGSDEHQATSAAAGKELSGYFASQVSRRRDSPGDDLISSLANGRIEGEPLPAEEIFGMCLIVYLAGNTTTSALISNGLLCLARHPEQRAALSGDPGLIENAVEELLRYESPVQWSSRVTTRMVAMHGLEVPAGERVMLLIGAAQRDPREWEDPDSLDVRRPPQRLLAFGDGVHRCVGAPLARLEGRVAFEEVFRRMPSYSLAGEPQRVYISTERGLAGLPLAV